MNQDIARKMHLIASQVGDLKDGRVKAFTGHQLGYATIVVVNKGCKVYAQHTRNDRLTIDLLTTKAASIKLPLDEKSAVAKFKAFASERNFETSEVTWQHSASKADARHGYSFEVTGYSPEQIRATVEALKIAFQSLP